MTHLRAFGVPFDYVSFDLGGVGIAFIIMTGVFLMGLSYSHALVQLRNVAPNLVQTIVSPASSPKKRWNALIVVIMPLVLFTSVIIWLMGFPVFLVLIIGGISGYELLINFGRKSFWQVFASLIIVVGALVAATQQAGFSHARAKHRYLVFTGDEEARDEENGPRYLGIQNDGSRILCVQIEGDPPLVTSKIRFIDPVTWSGKIETSVLESLRFPTGDYYRRFISD